MWLRPLASPRTRAGLALLVPIVLIATFAHGPAPRGAIYPTLCLPSVRRDADDCAIWIHPTDPARSVVIGNDKSGSRRGIYMYDLRGKVLQFVPIGRPSNLDVRYGMSLGDRSVDICAVVERDLNQVRVFAFDPATCRLSEVTGPKGVSTHIQGDTYGFALYRRPSDGALFAFATARHGGDVHQVQLRDNGHGQVEGILVRRFGGSAVKTLVEGMVADDELGFLYAADERNAVLKFHADPARGNALLQKFATDDGIRGDREGIAIYHADEATGYLLLSSQGNDTVKVYAREGDNRFLKTVFTMNSSHTDGLDVTSRPAGPDFPKGFLVCHDSPGRRFVLYPWQDVAGADLRISTAYDPRKTPVKPDHRTPH